MNISRKGTITLAGEPVTNGDGELVRVVVAGHRLRVQTLRGKKVLSRDDVEQVNKKARTGGKDRWDIVFASGEVAELATDCGCGGGRK